MVARETTASRPRGGYFLKGGRGLPNLAASLPNRYGIFWISATFTNRKQKGPKTNELKAAPPAFLGAILDAFQALRPAAPMETSVAGNPPRPGHRPAPSSSCSDGDLGRRSPRPPWTPSSPFVQLLRWRPRSPVILPVLGASQVLRPLAPMETSVAGLPRPFVR